MRKLKEVDVREAVRDHIKQKYRTQSAAAKALNISPAYVSDVLNGNRPMPEVMANDAGYKLVEHEAEWVKVKKWKSS